MFHLGNEGNAPGMEGNKMEGAVVPGVGQQPYQLELLMPGLQGERSKRLSCLSQGYFGQPSWFTRRLVVWALMRKFRGLKRS